MNEEPKSIRKKSWPTSSWFHAWLIVSAVAVFIFFVTALIVDLPHRYPDWLGDALFSLILGFMAATLALVVWAFVRWLCCRRNFKRSLFGLACFVTLIALFYVEEDWRGKRAWEQFKHEWETKGEKFNLADFVPAAVPDDRNFALTPIVASSYAAWLDKSGREQNPRRTNLVDRLQMSVDYDYRSPTNGVGDWQKSTVTDLKAWQQYYRGLAATTNLFPIPPEPGSPADDVLLALSKYVPAIEELRQAARLPGSRFPLNYDHQPPAGILLPHLAMLKRCSQVLQLRAIAELQNGRTDQALADVKLLLRLADSVRTEPFLISHLVRIAIVRIGLQPVWEGLVEHRWSDAQLVDLDRELARLDFLSDYEFAMRGERALVIANIEYLRRTREFSLLSYAEDGNSGSPPVHAAGFRLLPSSFFYRNELTLARMYQEGSLPMVEVARRVVSPQAVKRSQKAAGQELNHFSFYNIFARMLFPAYENAVRRFTQGQESVDLARVALALERYRFKQAEYPESLDGLAPKFIAQLPPDIINGQPLHYRRTHDGQFVLYSVGWNETDDGGVVAFTKGWAPRVDINRGDWVWQYPPR